MQLEFDRPWFALHRPVEEQKGVKLAILLLERQQRLRLHRVAIWVEVKQLVCDGSIISEYGVVSGLDIPGWRVAYRPCDKQEGAAVNDDIPNAARLARGVPAQIHPMQLFPLARRISRLAGPTA